jgi:hypothetical protein
MLKGQEEAEPEEGSAQGLTGQRSMVRNVMRLNFLVRKNSFHHSVSVPLSLLTSKDPETTFRPLSEWSVKVMDPTMDLITFSPGMMTLSKRLCRFVLVPKGDESSNSDTKSGDALSASETSIKPPSTETTPKPIDTSPSTGEETTQTPGSVIFDRDFQHLEAVGALKTKDIGLCWQTMCWVSGCGFCACSYEQTVVRFETTEVRNEALETIKDLCHQVNFVPVLITVQRSTVVNGDPFSACKNGELETLVTWYNLPNSSINGKNERDNESVYSVYVRVNVSGPLLHVAASFGHLHIVKWLLKEGANVDEKDNQGTTALHVAVSRANIPICKVVTF